MSLGQRISSLIPRLVGLAMGPLTLAPTAVPVFEFGSGVPTHTRPNGSLYVNISGTPTTFLYARTGGSWNQPGASLAGYATLANLASTAISLGASLIGTYSAGTYYPSTTVQAALQTIGAHLLQGGGTWSRVAVTVNTTSTTDGVTTGLAFAVVSGQTYRIEAWIAQKTSVSTNAPKYTWKATGGATATYCSSLFISGVSASTIENASTVALDEWSTQGTGPGVDNELLHLRTLLVCSGSGTITLFVRSETGGQVDVIAGSCAQLVAVP